MDPFGVVHFEAGVVHWTTPGSSKFKIATSGPGHKFFQISAENRLKTTPGGTVLKRRDRTWYGPGTVLNLDEQNGPRGNVGNVYVVP